MKPMFSPEVAQELGYQEYWPELHDWVFATIACLVGGFVITGGFILLVNYLK